MNQFVRSKQVAFGQVPCFQLPWSGLNDEAASGLTEGKSTGDKMSDIPCANTPLALHCDHQDLYDTSSSFSVGPEGSVSSIRLVCCWCGRWRTMVLRLDHAKPIPHGSYKPYASIP